MNLLEERLREDAWLNLAPSPPTLEEIEAEDWIHGVEERAIAGEEHFGKFEPCRVEDREKPGVFRNKFVTFGVSPDGKLETRELDHRFNWLIKHLGTNVLHHRLVTSISHRRRTVLVEPAGEDEEEALPVVSSIDMAVDGVLQGDFMFGVFNRYKMEKGDSAHIRISNSGKDAIYYIEREDMEKVGDSKKRPARAFFIPKLEYVTKTGVSGFFCDVAGIAPVEMPNFFQHSNYFERRFRGLQGSGCDIDIELNVQNKLGLVRSGSLAQIH